MYTHRFIAPLLMTQVAKMAHVGINGFGRIGRLVLRSSLERPRGITVVAVNGRCMRINGNTHVHGHAHAHTHVSTYKTLSSVPSTWPTSSNMTLRMDHTPARCMHNITPSTPFPCTLTTEKRESLHA